MKDPHGHSWGVNSLPELRREHKVEQHWTDDSLLTRNCLKNVPRDTKAKNLCPVDLDKESENLILGDISNFKECISKQPDLVSTRFRLETPGLPQSLSYSGILWCFGAGFVFLSSFNFGFTAVKKGYPRSLQHQAGYSGTSIGPQIILLPHIEMHKEFRE